MYGDVYRWLNAINNKKRDTSALESLKYWIMDEGVGIEKRGWEMKSPSYIQTQARGSGLSPFCDRKHKTRVTHRRVTIIRFEKWKSARHGSATATTCCVITIHRNPNKPATEGEKKRRLQLTLRFHPRKLKSNPNGEPEPGSVPGEPRAGVVHVEQVEGNGGAAERAFW